MVQLLFSLKSIPKYKQKEKMLIYRQQANIHKRLSHEHKNLQKTIPIICLETIPDFIQLLRESEKNFVRKISMLNNIENIVMSLCSSWRKVASFEHLIPIQRKEGKYTSPTCDQNHTMGPQTGNKITITRTVFQETGISRNMGGGPWNHPNISAL